MDRPTIREISTKYRLEPSLRDIFVEGKYDRVLFQWFLTRAGRGSAKVLSIDAIDIPASLLQACGLSEGNKQRVIALARELNGYLGDAALQFTCVVDVDEDRLLRRLHALPQLLYTDFACLEAYLFDEVHLGKFIHITLGCEGTNIRDLLNNYGTVLTTLFLIRGAIRLSELPIGWLPFTPSCAIDGTTIKLDVDTFIGRLLNAAGMHPRKGEILASMRELKRQVEGDSRHHLNGHDLADLLFWERRDEARRKELRNSQAVAAALGSCFEFDVLRLFPLFQKLIERTAI